MTDHVDAHCGPGNVALPCFSDIPADACPIPEDTGPNKMALGELFYHLNRIRATDDLDYLRANFSMVDWDYTGPIGSGSILGDLSSMRPCGAEYVISRSDDPRTDSVSVVIGFNSFPEFTKATRSACAGGQFVSDPPPYLVAASVERGQTGFELEHSWWCEANFGRT